MSKTPHTSHHEIYAIRRARNIFLGLLRDGRHKLPVKKPEMYTLTLYRGQKNIEWRTASISTKMWLDFFARGYHLFREAASFPNVLLSENCLFRGTDNLHGQIFKPHKGYCVYHSSNIITWKHSIGSEFDPVQWRSLIRLPEQKKSCSLLPQVILIRSTIYALPHGEYPVIVPIYCESILRHVTY